MFVGWVGAVDTCSVKLVATVMCLLVFLVSDIIGVTSLLWGDAVHWAWQSLDQAFGFCFWDFRGMYLHLCFWSFGWPSLSETWIPKCLWDGSVQLTHVVWS